MSEPVLLLRYGEELRMHFAAERMREFRIQVSRLFPYLAYSAGNRVFAALQSARNESLHRLIFPFETDVLVFRPVFDDGAHRISFDKRLRRPQRIHAARAHTHRLDDLDDRDFIFCGEFKVAFIVRGHPHHGSRAVMSEHIIRNVQRDFFTRRGVDRLYPPELYTGLVFLIGHSFQLRLLLALSDILLYVRLVLQNLVFFVCSKCYPRMLRRNGEKCRAEKRIGSRRKDGQMRKEAFEHHRLLFAFEVLLLPLSLDEARAELARKIFQIRDPRISLLQVSYLKYLAGKLG